MQTKSSLNDRQQALATDYKETENHLQDAMPRSVLESLVPKLDDKYNILAFELQKPMPEKDIEIARQLLERALVPCSKEVALNAMYALKIRTANTPAERDIAEERMALYLADLLQYPQDVVVDACRCMANHCRWFPAWADLRKELEWRVVKRRKQLEALNGCI